MSPVQHVSALPRVALGVSLATAVMALGLVSGFGHDDFAARAASGLDSVGSSVIAEPASHDSSFSEQRSPQHQGLLLVAVMFAGIAWLGPGSRQGRSGRLSRGPGRGGHAVLRDRGPPR